MRSERASAWGRITRECYRTTLTQEGLRGLRKAGAAVGLSSEDMEDLESAIGYRSEDLGVLYEKWDKVPKYRSPKLP